MSQKRGGDISAEVMDGLRRLAFESAASGISVVQEEGVNTLAAVKLDPFHITELKQLKGGGIEVKFYDRIEAMQKLCELTGNSGLDLFAAVERGAQAWADDDEEGDQNADS